MKKQWKRRLDQRLGAVLALLVGLVLWRCAPVRQVAPLPEGSTEVRASLGGPLIHFAGAVMPIPFMSLGLDHGIRERLTVGGTIYPTAWLFGAFQVDAHALYGLRAPGDRWWQPGVSAGAALNYTIDRWEWQQGLWPEVDLNVWWPAGAHAVVYAGLSNWFELKGRRAHDQPQSYHWIWNPHLGLRWGGGKWKYQLEARALAPFAPNDEVVVDYVKPWGRRGAAGVYFAVFRRIK